MATAAFVSCKKDEVQLSSDVVSKELQRVLKEEQVEKVAIWCAPKNNVVPGWWVYDDFSIDGRFLRVDDEYYNLAQLVSYSIDTYNDSQGIGHKMLRMSFGE